MIQPQLSLHSSGWWFQIFFTFTPTWGDDPILLIFCIWVETANQSLFPVVFLPRFSPSRSLQQPVARCFFRLQSDSKRRRAQIRHSTGTGSGSTVVLHAHHHEVGSNKQRDLTNRAIRGPQKVAVWNGLFFSGKS